MLFNSFEFIVVFLPVTLLVYFALTHNGLDNASKVWLLLASLFFYSWWNPNYLPLILISLTFNYLVGRRLGKKPTKLLLGIGIVANVSALVFFKYFNFLAENFNNFFNGHIGLFDLILPLGISFITFQKIAYLVDSYKGITYKYTFYDYCLFVVFFPQLIAGPIVHHQEIIPQFFNRGFSRVNYENLTKGIFIFCVGLAKKIIIADTFAILANRGYTYVHALENYEAWISTFSYSIQLYFDFSGYSDMAIGLGLMFNIIIPINFNSPYRADSIQDFWRRWHITLSRFLRDYIYIPLGGNRGGDVRTSANLITTFLIGGIWHGAAWTFVFWGLLHGVALVVHRYWTKLGIVMARPLAIALTFLFVNFAWIFFRAGTWTDATRMIESMGRFHIRDTEFVLINDIYSAPIWIIGIALLFMRNTQEIAARFTFNFKYALILIGLIVIDFLYLNSSLNAEFLYFDF